MAETLSLPDDLAAVVDAAVATGDYPDREAALRAALEAWQARRDEHAAAIAKVRRLWDEGLASGPSLDGDAVLDELRERFCVAKAG